MTDEDLRSASTGQIAPRAIATRTEFAEQLGLARTAAGVPLRSLAHSLDTSPSTISGWMTGRHLPNLRQIDLLRRLLAELRISPPEVERWIDALQRVRTAPGPRRSDETAPYRGLEPFDINDAEWFFGREALTHAVLARLGEAERLTGPPRITVLVGSSGAGKSSVLRAGVVPRLQASYESGRAVAVVSPGATPFERLAERLAPFIESSADAVLVDLRDRPCDVVRQIASHQLVLIVDQLEELFTHATEQESNAFLDCLLALASGPQGVSVVVAIRADFYGRLAEVEGLTETLETRQIVAAPMTSDELSRAIAEPAKHAGIAIDGALVAALLDEFAPNKGSASRSGALPLLSHVLLETWKRSRRGAMTIADYRASGGLSGAIEQTAETVYRAFTEREQTIAQQLLLRLVNIDADGFITRRSAKMEDVVPEDGGAAAETEAVLLQLVSSRLITIDEFSVTLSHEALLAAWPRLHDWVVVEQEGMLLHRQLHDAASVWESSGNDESTLLAGARLESASEWLASERGAAWGTARERGFVVESRQRADREARHARRRRLTLMSLVAAAVVLATVAGAAAVVASRARSEAERDRNDALSRRVALQAERIGETDTAVAAQMALVAFETSPTVEARSGLLDSRARATPARYLGEGGATALALSGDRALFGVTNAIDGTVQLFKLDEQGRASRSAVAEAPGEPAEFYAVAISPNGELLAAGGANNTVLIWALDSGKPLLINDHLGTYPGAVQALAFSPDGAELAVGMSGTEIARWNIAQPGAPSELPPMRSETVTKSVAYSPDGTHLAAGGSDGVLHVWNLETSTETGTYSPVDRDEVHTVAFNPDGRSLAVGYRGTLVRLFDFDEAGGVSEAIGPDPVFTTWVNSLAFSPDGSTLTAGSSDSTVRTWRTDDWIQVFHATVPAPITGVAYLGDGRSIATVSTDGTARVWPTDQSPVAGPRASVFSISFSGDGSRMAVFPGRRDGTVEVWDTTRLPAMSPVNIRIPSLAEPQLDGSGVLLPNASAMIAGTSTGPSIVWDLSDAATAQPSERLLDGPTALVEAVAVSPNGDVVAIGSDDGNVHLWDFTDPVAPVKVDAVLQATNQVLDIAFDSDSERVAVASADTKVYLWNIADLGNPRLESTMEGFESYAQAVAFSDDGTLLAAGSADATVRVWDVTEPTRPIQQGEELTGPQNYVYTLDFQPGTRLLAAGVLDNTVWLWDLENPSRPEHFATLNAATAPVNTVEFSPDGRYLLSAGSDQLIYIWDTNLASVTEWVCGSSGEGLTRDEWTHLLGDIPYRAACGRAT